jgi:hypothetical protein
VAPGSIGEPCAETLVDLAPGVTQAGRLQPVAADPQQPHPLGHGPQQLHRVALGGPGSLARGLSGRRQAGGAGGDAGLGGGQAAVGEQGEPVAVGGKFDQGVEAGEQPTVRGWHGGSLRGAASRPAAACHGASPARRGMRRSVDGGPATRPPADAARNAVGWTLQAATLPQL